jgi:hypothetical protein
MVSFMANRHGEQPSQHRQKQHGGEDGKDPSQPARVEGAGCPSVLMVLGLTVV